MEKECGIGDASRTAKRGWKNASCLERSRTPCLRVEILHLLSDGHLSLKAFESSGYQGLRKARLSTGARDAVWDSKEGGRKDA